MDFRGPGVFEGGKRSRLEAATKSKTGTLLRCVGCEGKKWRLLERAAVAAVFRGSQAQLGQKLRATLRGDNDGRITRLLERLEKQRGGWSHSRTYMRVQVMMTGEQGCEA